MQIAHTSEGAPGATNEDYVTCGNSWAIILDGATARPDMNSGCIHDVPWLVHQLAAALAKRMVTETNSALDDILAASIQEVGEAHSGTCDLANPDSPSSTVSIVRISEATIQYLTLGDSPIVLWDPEQRSRPILDARTDNLPGGRPYATELLWSLRNQPDGYWVANTKPDAAYHAITDTVKFHPETEIGLFTDGATRLVEFYGYSWDSFFDLLRKHGPTNLIKTVRTAERDHKPPYGKKHDDATAVHIAFIGGSSTPG